MHECILLLDFKTYTYIQVIYFYQKCRSKATKKIKKSTEQQNDKKSNNNNRKPMKKNSKITNKNAFSARYSPNDSLTLCATFAHHRPTWHEIQRRNHFRSIEHSQRNDVWRKKNVIAKCDHASTSPKQFRKSYKMVTLNYGRFRFGYRNSSIRRLNSQIHAIYAGKRITKMYRLMFGWDCLLAVFFSNVDRKLWSNWGNTAVQLARHRRKTFK